MRFLLDTHAAVWCFTDSPHLSHKSRTAITDADNEIYVSVVSAWEIAIKRSLRKDPSILCTAAEFLAEIETRGFELLKLNPRHVIPIESLPYHHRDPFDRLLIATAIAEDMTFMSADENVAKYEVKSLW